MNVLNLTKAFFSNKVLMYMATRYATYGLSFFVTMYVASRMGPYFYGIWGYVMLLLNYFNMINLGIPQAAQVLQIQSRDNLEKRSDYEKSGLFLMGVLSLGVVALGGYYGAFGITFLQKYELGNLFYWVCLCGILNYFNLYYSKVYRVKNRLFEIAFHQTVVVFLMFVVMFVATEYRLLQLLLGCYVVAYLASFLLYSFRGGATYDGKLRYADCKEVINKGLYLFLYNSGFYFIMISTKTIVSMNYSVVEFGYFTFAYYLGYAVLQLLEAFSYLISAKLLDKYRSDDVNVVLSTIRLIRVNYVALFHGIMYLAMIFFPVLIHFIPKYADTLLMIYLACLTMLLFTNSFGYSTFLMARNREKTLAVIAMSSLFLNIGVGLFLVHVVHISYQYVILPTLFTYFLYAFMCVYAGRKELHLGCSAMDVLKDSFPVRLLIPFLSAVVIVILDVRYFIFVPFVLFALCNMQTIKEIFFSFKKVFFRPEIIDV